MGPFERDDGALRKRRWGPSKETMGPFEGDDGALRVPDGLYSDGLYLVMADIITAYAVSAYI